MRHDPPGTMLVPCDLIIFIALYSNSYICVTINFKPKFSTEVEIYICALLGNNFSSSGTKHFGKSTTEYEIRALGCVGPEGGEEKHGRQNQQSHS